MDLEVLTREEALALLATAPVGRIVFTDRALPAIQPVNFFLDDGLIVIRSGPGSKLSAAVRNSVVAFEADEIDPETKTGWSVVVTGVARVVKDEGELERLRSKVKPWAPGDRNYVILISPDMVTGRRISADSARTSA